MTTDTETVYKRRCTGGCNRILPFTTDHFYRTPEPPYLRADCKDCFKANRGTRTDGAYSDINKIRQAARRAAFNRLCAIHPDMWAKLLTDEYRKRDLADPDMSQGRPR